MQNVDLNLYRGDDTTFVFNIKSNGVPIDTEDKNFKIQLLTSCTHQRINVTDITKSGTKLIVRFPSSLTRNSRWKEAKYDIEMEYGSVITTIVKGRVRVTLGSARIDVTKPVFYQDRPYITNQGPIQFEGNISVNVPTGQHPIFTMRRDGGNVAYVGFTNSGRC